MITQRLQEIIQEQNLSLKELSEASSIPEDTIQNYMTSDSIELNQKNTDELRKIATALNVSVVDLVNPVSQKKAYILKIIELAQQRGMTLGQVSERSEINPIILEFYSTQAIAKKTIELEPHSQNLDKISRLLNCTVEDLKVEADLPKIRLDIEEIAAERGLTLEELSLLVGLPFEVIQLIATQPMDIDLDTKTFLNLFNSSDEDVTPLRQNRTLALASRDDRIIGRNTSGLSEIIGRMLCCALNRPCCNG